MVDRTEVVLNMSNSKENEKLISADPERGEYAPVLRVLIAVCYMGVVAAIVAFLAALLSYVSNGMGIDKMAVSSVSFAVFCAVIIGMSIADRKKSVSMKCREKNSQTTPIDFRVRSRAARSIKKRSFTQTENTKK